MEITVNNEVLQFNMQSWWGPMYIFEEVMDLANHPERRFNPAKTAHLHIMFYCILIDDNPNLTITLEDFIKAMSDLQLHTSLLDYYNKRVSVLLDLQPAQNENQDKPSKKKTLPHTKHTSA
jgi:hypothetical protein